MSGYRVKALFLRDLYVYRRLRWKPLELIYFPLTSLVIFGFFSRVLARDNPQAAELMLGVLVVWNFAGLVQGAVNMAMMEDIWSGSLKQILLGGTTAGEMFAARMASATCLSTAALALMVLACRTSLVGSEFAFDLGPFLLLNLWTWLSALGLAAWIAGAVIFLGRDYGFVTWMALQSFIVISCPYYPLDQLPHWLATAVKGTPFGLVFWGLFPLSRGQAVPANLHWHAALVGTIYLATGLAFQTWSFAHARRTGKILRFS